MDFNIYVRQGLLKKQAANLKQIGNQIEQAEKDLSTVEKVIKIDSGWAATISYQAMLRAGRALIFAHGYLPSDGQQHKTVVELTGKLLGEELSTTVFQFDKMRKKRNIFFYDSVDSATDAEAKNAVYIARKLISAVKEKLIRLDPQLKLKLE